MIVTFFILLVIKKKSKYFENKCDLFNVLNKPKKTFSASLSDRDYCIDFK